MNRSEVIFAITEARDECMNAGLGETAVKLVHVLDAFAVMETRAAAILGAKGGKIGGLAKTEAKTLANRENANRPPKEGKRPRGRPRKANPL